MERRLVEGLYFVISVWFFIIELVERERGVAGLEIDEYLLSDV